MAIDVKTTGSPGWWLKRETDRLTDPARQKRIRLLGDYASGRPPLPYGGDTAREAFQQFMEKARSNFAKLIVRAAMYRLRPIGMATGADSDEIGDARAWQVWAAAGMKPTIIQILSWMLIYSESYGIVGDVDPETGVPLVTAEHPAETYAEPDPTRPDRALAGVKLIYDDVAERDVAFLHRPGRVHVAYRERRAPRVGKATPARFNPDTWSWDEDRGGEAGERLNTDRMALIRFDTIDGVGEFEEHLDLLDRINTTILQRMTIAAMQAFRQRAVKGLPEKDDKGNVIDYSEVFAADPGALWQLPATADMWESGQVDLTGVLSATKDDVQHLAVVTGTPMYMFAPDGVTQSAQGAALSREALIDKCDVHIDQTSPRVARLAAVMFDVMGDSERADLSRMEIRWAPTERLGLTERSQAAAQAGDVPWRTKMIKIWGFSPQEVDRMEAERAADRALEAAFAAPAAGGNRQTGQPGTAGGTDDTGQPGGNAS